MEVNIDRKSVTESIKRPLCFQFRFRDRFSQRETLKQSPFLKELGSGIENAAEALIFKTNDLKVSETISGGKFYLERAIMKARNRKLLIAEQIRITDQRFRNYLNLLRRNPRIVEQMQSKHLPQDSSTFRNVTDPVEHQNCLSEEDSAEFDRDECQLREEFSIRRLYVSEGSVNMVCTLSNVENCSKREWIPD
jgi:hypothetical protein